MKLRNLFAAHLTSLGDFAGRETRRQFWPWAGLVFVGSVLTMIFSISVIRLLQSGPLQFMQTILTAAAIAFLAIGLLAAAISRRLHDRGIAAYWGLLPLPFLIGGLWVLTRPLWAPVKAETLPALEIIAAALALAYNVTLCILVLLLALPGQSNKNRYGPHSVNPD